MSTEQTNFEETTIWNKNFICVMLSNFMLCLSHAAINPHVATYTKYLNTSAQLTGFLTGMFFAVSLACRPFAGPVTTKLDKRKVLIFVFALGAFTDMCYALFHSVPAFIAVRFLSGIQFSLVGSLLMTLAGDHLPKAKLAYGLGMYGIGGAIANAVAPSIGEWILKFGTNLKNEGFGFTLVFLYAMAIFLLAIIPALMIAPDRKTKAEVASTGAWYKNIFTIHALPATIVLFFVMMAYSLLNTYMFEFGKERGIDGISVFYLVFALSLAVSRPMSGFLTSKLGIAKIMFPALIVFSLAMFSIGGSNALWMLLVGAVLAAIGFGSSQPSLQAMCMQSETAIKRGVATNTLYMGIDLGLFLGPYLGGLVYGGFDYSVMFKAGAVPLLIAAACFAVILPIYKRRLKILEG